MDSERLSQVKERLKIIEECADLLAGEKGDDLPLEQKGWAVCRANRALNEARQLISSGSIVCSASGEVPAAVFTSICPP